MYARSQNLNKASIIIDGFANDSLYTLHITLAFFHSIERMPTSLVSYTPLINTSVFEKQQQ